MKMREKECVFIVNITLYIIMLKKVFEEYFLLFD